MGRQQITARQQVAEIVARRPQPLTDQQRDIGHGVDRLAGVGPRHADRPPRVYLSNVFDETTLGLVEGSHKYVLDDALQITAAYDLLRSFHVHILGAVVIGVPGEVYYTRTIAPVTEPVES